MKKENIVFTKRQEDVKMRQMLDELEGEIKKQKKIEQEQRELRKKQEAEELEQRTRGRLNSKSDNFRET